MTEGSKRCVSCGEVKPLCEFRRHAKSKDGYEFRCLDCRAGGDMPLDQGEKRRRHAEKMRRWREENPEAARNAERRRRLAVKADPERLRKYREFQNNRDRSEYQSSPRWHEMKRRSDRGSWLRRNYGIELADFERLMEQQGGVCAICGALPPTGYYKQLAVDHCHETGAVRGLLCSDCNRGLGIFRDNPGRLERAAEYLRSSPAENGVLTDA